MTRRLKEVVKELRLECIHTGSLGSIPNNPYLRAKLVLAEDIGFDEDKVFYMHLNHFEPDKICWTVWKTPMMSKSEALKIRNEYCRAKGRRLWDSVQLYASPPGDAEVYIVL